jgi:hypothetical protein
VAASAAGAVDDARHASRIIMPIMSNIVHIGLALKRGLVSAQIADAKQVRLPP